MTGNNSGFTLIELLVVVLIIGVLSAIALPQYTTAVEKSRAAEALTLMSATRDAVERYRFQKDAWPSANNFAVLDVEIPQNGSNYGGKNYKITMQPLSDPAKFVINATRNTNKEQYQLKTVMVDNGSVIQTYRYCGAVNDGAEKPTQLKDSDKNGQYCNAITNGNPVNGKF
ncbi:type IV pilin protein [Candidatus Avelusimicrobium stercoris]|uniref:type IV pilin protein n=1 Tax=Candidatus Avelusimicrobium stercoris TaxID=1947924 RepID=UPI000EEB528B|nr:pilus assembly protein PilE [Elusimicrobiota bacterium]